MSGGYFGYRQWGMRDAADAVEDYAREHGAEHTPETLARIRQSAATLRRAAHMLHCVDYLASADYGEESFAEAWAEQATSPDDSRREFEAWVTVEPVGKSVARHPSDPVAGAAWPGQYLSYDVQLAWEAWEMARARAEDGWS